MLDFYKGLSAVPTAQVFAHVFFMLTVLARKYLPFREITKVFGL